MAKFGLDHVDKFYEMDIFFPTRTIFMGSAEEWEDGESGVNHAMAETMIKGLHILDQKEDPITIIMNNPGGDATHGMAIYDAIQACRSHITIKVFGHAMSMGSIILQAADERVMAPHSSFMIHYGYFSVSGHAPTSLAWAEESKKYDKWMEDLYLEKIRTRKPKFRRDVLKKLLTVDTVWTPEETIAHGLADRIL